MVKLRRTFYAYAVYVIRTFKKYPSVRYMADVYLIISIAYTVAVYAITVNLAWRWETPAHRLIFPSCKISVT